MKERPASTVTGMPVIEGLETFPIPCAEGHDVVYGLAAGRGNEIYLAASNEFTAGLCALVLAFNVVTRTFRIVIDVQRETGFDPGSGMMPHSKIHLALKSTAGGRLFAATHFTAPGVGQTSFDAIAAYRGKYPGCFLLEYDPHRDRVINHGLLVKGEGARIACLDEQHHQYYFLSYPRNHLYRYDYRRRVLHDLGRIGQENSFGLESDGRGNVYTSDDMGRLLRYSLRHDRLEELGLFVPLAAGRRAAGNFIRRMIRSADGSFYGFGNKGVRLFQLDASRGRIEDFGVIYGCDDDVGRRRPTLPPAKAMVQSDPRTLLIAFGGDGIYIDQHPVPNLVRYDLIERRATDCGKFVCPVKGAPAWIPQCALVVPRARAVFFGLQQTAGPLRLWKVDLARLGRAKRKAPHTACRRHSAIVASKPFGASIEGAEPLPFVRHGHVRMHELGWRGEDLLIPAGETAVSALHFGGGHTLYGVTTGARSHLFSFAPYTQNRFTENYEVHPWDLGVIHPKPVRAAKLFPDRDRHRLLVALKSARETIVLAYPIGAERSAYRATYHSVPHWPPVAWTATPLQRLLNVANAAVSFENLTHLPATDTLVSKTPDGALLRLNRDGTTRPLQFGAAVAAVGLVAVGENQLFVVTRTGEGMLLRVEAQHKPAVVAVFPGLGSSPASFAANSAGTQLAIGSGDGAVEILDFRDRQKHLTLRLRERWRVRALAWHQTGRLYGFYGADNGIGEAFNIEPAVPAIREIGILQVSSQPRYWMCHQCEAMAVGARGETYFGESDRLAHLFSYVDEPAPGPLPPRNR